MKLLLNMTKTISYLGIILVLFSGAMAQSIQIFSPESGSSLPSADVFVAASFFGIEGVQPGNVKLLINGEDLSNEADIDQDMLSFTPVDLSPGPQHIQIIINRPGIEPVLQSWNFTVLGEDEVKKFNYEISGRATSGFRYEKFGEEELSIAQIGGSINGSTMDWIKFRSNVKLTTEENPLLQTRNRFGFGLSLGKYLELNIGDFNPRVTKFTLDGKRIRGFGLKTQLGIWHFSGVFGELNRVIQGDESVDKSYKVNSFTMEGTDKILSLTRNGYTFKQNVLSVRTGFGRGQKFQIGFGFLKVKDDIGSIDSDVSNALINIDSSFTGMGIAPGEYKYSDLIKKHGSSGLSISLDEKNKWAGKTPNDNLVVSSDIGFFFDNKRIVLEGEIAFSMLNRNIWDGAVSLAGLDTLMDEDLDGSLMGEFELNNIPFDPVELENIFVINQNMSPLIPISPDMFGDSSNVSALEAIFSMPSLAYRTKAKFNYFGNNFSVEYSQVGPEFKSLANPYLLNNNREYSISDRIQLMNGRMMLSLMYKHQDDNIMLDQPVVKSRNTISANMTYLPGPNLPTITLMFRSADRENGVSALDTLENMEDGITSLSYADNRENTRTGNISATVNHRMSAFGLNHNVSATIMSFNRKDLVSEYRNLDSNFVDPKMTSQVINLVATTKFGIPLKTIFSLTMNGAEFNTGPSLISNQDLVSVKFEGEYKIMNQRLAILGGVNYLSGKGLSEVSRLGFLGGAKYRIRDDLHAQIRTELRQNLVAESNKNTVIGIASLNYSF